MNEKKERIKYLRKSNIHKLLLNMIKPLMLCPSNMRVISSKHSLTLFLQYISANDNNGGGGGGGDDDDDDDGFD